MKGVINYVYTSAIETINLKRSVHITVDLLLVVSVLAPALDILLLVLLITFIRFSA